jgi:DNA-binding LacI/PurR family transcriptional regulator
MSIHRVAQGAGVSVATVSRVFNDPERVAASTRIRVLEAARTLSYLPNQSARTLRTQRSRIMGAILPSRDDPVYVECMNGIAAAVLEAGYVLAPIACDSLPDREADAARWIVASGAEGCVLLVTDVEASAALPLLGRSGVPYALMHHQDDRHPCVSIDSRRALADLVARLESLGHREIVRLVPQPAFSRVQEARPGDGTGDDSAARASRVRHIDMAPGADPVRQIGLLLSSPTRPTALLCTSDLLAIDCLRAAALQGLQVPRDLTVVGFDGIALGARMFPMLAAVVQPHAAIGRHAVELVLRAIAGGRAPTAADSLLLPHGMREGESCGPPPFTAHGHPQPGHPAEAALA